MDNLGWAQDLVAAPDLEAAGSVIHQRLTAYTAVGAPQSERTLAERLAFEHQVRHYMARANERGFAFAQQFAFFASRWVDFVNQNKAAEDELGRQDRQEQYERGWADAATALAKASLAAPPSSLPVVAVAPATAPVTLSDAVHQTIDALVKAEVAKQVAKTPAPTGAAAGGQPAGASGTGGGNGGAAAIASAGALSGARREKAPAQDARPPRHRGRCPIRGRLFWRSGFRQHHNG